MEKGHLLYEFMCIKGRADNRQVCEALGDNHMETPMEKMVPKDSVYLTFVHFLMVGCTL